MSICATCGKEYQYKHSRNSKKECASCIVNRHKHRQKDRCLEYKGGKCCICGYDRCKRALTFHHLDPKTKSFEVSGSHCRNWEVMKQELDKTILVCANCHAEIESGLLSL